VRVRVRVRVHALMRVHVQTKKMIKKKQSAKPLRYRTVKDTQGD